MKRFGRQAKTKQEEQLDKFDLNKHIQKYKNTTFFTEQLSNGKFIHADRFSLIRESHILMKTYGLGGCKSFTEFVEMVNEEDPVIIDTLMAIITEDARCEAGFKPREINLDFEPIVTHSISDDTSNLKHKTVDIASSPVMGLLSNFGNTYGEINEKVKIQKEVVGEFSHDDFSDITSASISSPDFDLQSALKRLTDAKNKSFNVRITPDMWSGRKKKKKNI